MSDVILTAKEKHAERGSFACAIWTKSGGVFVYREWFDTGPQRGSGIALWPDEVEALHRLLNERLK